MHALSSTGLRRPPGGCASQDQSRSLHRYHEPHERRLFSTHRVIVKPGNSGGFASNPLRAGSLMAFMLAACSGMVKITMRMSPGLRQKPSPGDRCPCSPRGSCCARPGGASRPLRRYPQAFAPWILKSSSANPTIRYPPGGGSSGGHRSPNINQGQARKNPRPLRSEKLVSLDRCTEIHSVGIKKGLAGSANPLIFCGGDDETRTRDLRRDRPAF